MEFGLQTNLPVLVRRVEICLETVLVVDNFLPESELKEAVIKFIKVNLNEVMKDPNWGKFVEYCSELVMEILAEDIDHHMYV